MKLSKLMFRHATLTISSIMVLILSPLLSNSVMAAETSGQASKPYQSSFEGYKPLSDENVADWKTLNEQSATAGRTMPGMSGNSDMSNMQGMDHSKMKGTSPTQPGSSDISTMQGMDHSKMKGMDPPAANTKPGNSEMSSMEGMNHSKMQGMNMDNSNAKANSSDMSNKQGMDHSKMKGMSPSAPNTQPSKSDMSNMEGMDHSKMQGMSKGKSDEKSSKSDMSSMKGMKMDNPDAKPGSSDMSNMPGMDHSNMKSTDSTAADAKPDNADTSKMEGMDHSKMQGMNQNEAANTQQFRIVPNLHPIAIHFPIVLIVIAFIFSLAAFTLRQHALATHLAATGRFSLWLAGLSAVIAALLGWLAFNSVNHDDAGHAAMLLHRAWAIPTASGIALLAAWDIWKNRATDIMSIPALILLFLLSASIAVTGWLGGEVVYRHGIGVLSMPTMEATGNGNKHEHGTAKVMPSADSAAQTAPNKEGESHEH